MPVRQSPPIEDDDIRFRLMLRHKAAALEGEAREDLDLHGADHLPVVHAGTDAASMNHDRTARVCGVRGTRPDQTR